MKLFVGNLPFTVSQEEFKNLFSSYGEIEEASLITDKFSGRSKGFGFVTFTNDADAEKAISEMDGKDVQGREIKVSEAKPMEDRPKKPFNRDRNSGGFGNRDRKSFGNNNRRFDNRR